MKVTFFFTSTKVGFQLPNVGYVPCAHERSEKAFEKWFRTFSECQYGLAIFLLMVLDNPLLTGLALVS